MVPDSAFYLHTVSTCPTANVLACATCGGVCACTSGDVIYRMTLTGTATVLFVVEAAGNLDESLRVFGDSTLSDTSCVLAADTHGAGPDFEEAQAVLYAGTYFVAVATTADTCGMITLVIDRGPYVGVDPAPEVPDAPTLRILRRAGEDIAARLALPRRAPVRVAVFDVAGRRVRTLADGPLGRGVHVIVWDGRDESGRRVSSGVYFCRAIVGAASLGRSFVLTR